MDAVKPGPGETVFGPLPIIAVSGTTTCTVGGTLPCDLGAGAFVVFGSNVYVVQPGDPDPLPDQGRIQVQDLCDVSGGAGGCSTKVNVLQASASTDLITGCGPGPTCTPTPTPTSTSTPTGTPPNTPTNTATVTNTAPPGTPPAEVPTLSFPMLALLGLMLAGAGLFLARRG